MPEESKTTEVKKAVRNHKWLLVIVLAVAIAIGGIWYFTTYIEEGVRAVKNHRKKITSNGNGSGSSGNGSGSSNSSSEFPVTVNSPASAITAAMVQSGYYQQLVDEGNPEAPNVYSDPVGQLKSHPYLVEAYPEYFASS
jgi:hypothetical protein